VSRLRIELDDLILSGTTRIPMFSMSEYAQRFAENDIDIAVVPDLAYQHLKDLGVSLGPRLKMLRPIRELAGDTPVTAHPLVVTESKPQDAADAARSPSCSATWSARLPSRLASTPKGRGARSSARTTDAAPISLRRPAGSWPSTWATACWPILAIPRAHGHDAERTVRAGLALVEAVPKLATAAGSPLQVRVGIATGLVVVGDLSFEQAQVAQILSLRIYGNLGSGTPRFGYATGWIS
jgi:hypothetical protein